MMKKKVLVLGGTKGIGKSIYKKFNLDNKYNTIAFGSKQLDTGNKESVKKFISKYNSTDVLILNTGGPPFKENILKIHREEWLKYFDQIFLGFYEILSNIKIKNNGYVFLISSHLISENTHNMLISSSLRAGFLHVFRAISKEYYNKKVTFLNIAPGPIKTQRLYDLNNGNFNKLIKKIPAGYISKPEELSKLIFFIVDQKIKYLTDKTILFDGGLSSSYYS